MDDAIANRPWLIHQYEIDRALTRVTLSRDCALRREPLANTFRLAEVSLSTPRTQTTSSRSRTTPFSLTFAPLPDLPPPQNSITPNSRKLPEHTYCTTE